MTQRFELFGRSPIESVNPEARATANASSRTARFDANALLTLQQLFPGLLLRALAFLAEPDALSVAFCAGGLLPVFAALAQGTAESRRVTLCAWQARQALLRRFEVARASNPRLAALEQHLSQIY